MPTAMTNSRAQARTSGFMGYLPQRMQPESQSRGNAPARQSDGCTIIGRQWGSLVRQSWQASMSLLKIWRPMRGGTLPYAQTRNPSEHLNSSSFSFCEWPRSVLDARLGSGRAQLGEREKMKIGLS